MKEKKQENEKENIVIDSKGAEIEVKPKKLKFYKKVWYSIAKFEKYTEMSNEGVGRAVKYLLQIVGIFVLIISCLGIFNANKNLNGFISNIENNVPDFKYSEGNITLENDSENKVYTINDTSLNFGKIIIDLNEEDENIISEYEKTIKDSEETNNIGLIVLKDKIIQIIKLEEGIEGETRISMTYSELMQNLFRNDELELTKSDLIRYLSGNGRTSILIVNFISLFIAYFIIYVSSGVIYALVLGLIGFISAKITKLKLTFAQLFNMSVYAFTLSNVLNMIYFIVNYFWGISTKYFDIAYITIAYIYLIAVLSLIKLDTTKKQEDQVKKEEKEENKETDGQEQI